MRPLLAALLVVTLAPSPATADPHEDAKIHYQKASTFYDVGEYKQALNEFKAAYLAKPDPVFLFNMGQCYRMLHEPGAAGTQYRAYLRRNPDAPNREAVEKFIKAAEAEEAAQRASTVQPTGTLTPKEERNPPPATVEGQPPTPATATEPPSTAAPAAATETPPDKPASDGSILRKWWLWAAIGAVVVVGAAVGIGVALGSRPDAPIPNTTTGFVFLSFK